MTKFFSFLVAFILFIVPIFAAHAEDVPAAGGLNREELEKQIREREKELQTLEPQLESVRKTLSGARAEKKTLQSELSSIERNISQLDLSMRADELRMQKLNYEIESLQYDLSDMKEAISEKETAVGAVLNEISRADRKMDGGLFAIFLRNANLAESVMEVQSLANLQFQLNADIESLESLHSEYNDKLSESNEKRKSVKYHKLNLENKKVIAEDQKTERVDILKVAKNRESNYQAQLKELEALQQKIASEMEALSAVLRTKIDPSTLPAISKGVLLMPVAVGREYITQDYGSTGFAKYNYRGKWHNGIDIGSPVGTPIYAADEGEVVAVGDEDKFCPRAAYGKFIVVKHPNNLVTLYAHMSRQTVKRGEHVNRGELIGYVGKTGWATGPHLHFTVFAAPTYYLGLTKSCGPMPFGGDLNPMGYL